MKGSIFGDREFKLTPTFTKISNQTPRDHNFWLIVVRAQNTGQVSYPGCKLDAVDPTVQTSVTDSTCDGGIITIPPNHLKLPSVLGHETLHLFGLVDRYMSVTKKLPGKPPKVTNSATRQTGGRPDPLGTEDGTILEEDLGVYFFKTWCL